MNIRFTTFVFAVLCAIGANASVDREGAYNTQHTVQECASYMCSNADVARIAQKYLTTGCEGSFTNFVSSINTKEKTSMSATTESTQGISTSALVGMAGSLGLVGMVVGFIAGRRERPPAVAYSKIPMTDN